LETGGGSSSLSGNNKNVLVKKDQNEKKGKKKDLPLIGERKRGANEGKDKTFSKGHDPPFTSSKGLKKGGFSEKKRGLLTRALMVTVLGKK